jgi:hypothetical protein
LIDWTPPTRFPEESPYSVAIWPRGTLAGLVLAQLAAYDPTQRPLLVSNTAWVKALHQAQETAEQIIVGDRSRINLVRKRKITDPASKQTFVLWGDGSALTARFCEDGNAMLVHPEVIDVPSSLVQILWNLMDPDKRTHWSSLPHHPFLTALGDTPVVPAFAPGQTGPLAAWFPLRWVPEGAAASVRDVIENCACWIGIQGQTWPEQWLVTVQASAIATDGSLSNPSLQWGGRVLPGHTQTTHQATATKALQTWLLSDASPLAGLAGVAHGEPADIGDSTGTTVVDFCQHPAALSAHAKLAKAQRFAQQMGHLLAR